MTPKSIAEIITRFENLNQVYHNEIHDLEKKIVDLEKLRFQFAQDVEADGTNPEIRTRLLNIEKDLNTYKKKFHAKQAEFSDKMKKIRADFIEAQNEIIAQAKTRLKNLEKDREILRSDSIPETERRLEMLNDRKKKLDIEILNLINTVNELEKEGEQWLQKM